MRCILQMLICFVYSESLSTPNILISDSILLSAQSCTMYLVLLSHYLSLLLYCLLTVLSVVLPSFQGLKNVAFDCSTRIIYALIPSMSSSSSALSPLPNSSKSLLSTSSLLASARSDKTCWY